MDTDMQYKGFIIRPVTILLERGYGLRVEIFEHDGGQIAPHHIPTFEETFETREEAIEFGLAEGKKLIDSGQRTVRPFLRRFSRNSAKPCIQL
jgi:hypothetical protein